MGRNTFFAIPCLLHHFKALLCKSEVNGFLLGCTFWIPQHQYYSMFARPYVCSICRRPSVASLLKQPQSHNLHASYPLGLPRRKDFFSSNAFLSQKQSRNGDLSQDLLSETQKQRRRGARNPAAPTSLRRVAVEAQRSKDGILSKAQLKEQGIYQTKVSTTAPSSKHRPLILD
jgi:hypothetical protein